MNKHTFLAISIFAITLMAANVAEAQRPNRNPVLVYDDVRGGACSTTDASLGFITPAMPQGTVLFNRTFVGQPNPNFCTPVLNPDGSQMTLGQFNRVSGKAIVNCPFGSTLTLLSFTGLRPKGVYSVWIFSLGAAPGPPIGIGSLGRRSLGEGSFEADADGNGSISRTTPEQDLSMFGHIGPCMLDAPFFLRLAYHSDGLTHGADPGAPEASVANLDFFFQ